MTGSVDATTALKLHRFITVEGIEGVGKSTHVNFIRGFLEQHHRQVVATREPGGTPVAEKIRALLLDNSYREMSVDAELLLMFAGRADHLQRVILPALRREQWVVCDRFTDATYAYQGGGRHIPLHRIAALETWVQAEIQPGFTLLLDAPVDVALKRTVKRGPADRFEQETTEFFARVRQVYLERAVLYSQRYRVIDANLPLEEVEEQIRLALETYVKTHD